MDGEIHRILDGDGSLTAVIFQGVIFKFPCFFWFYECFLKCDDLWFLFLFWIECIIYEFFSSEKQLVFVLNYIDTNALHLRTISTFLILFLVVIA